MVSLLVIMWEYSFDDFDIYELVLILVEVGIIG